MQKQQTHTTQHTQTKNNTTLEKGRAMQAKRMRSCLNGCWRTARPPPEPSAGLLEFFFCVCCCVTVLSRSQSGCGNSMVTLCVVTVLGTGRESVEYTVDSAQCRTDTVHSTQFHNTQGTDTLHCVPDTCTQHTVTYTQLQPSGGKHVWLPSSFWDSRASANLSARQTKPGSSP